MPIDVPGAGEAKKATGGAAGFITKKIGPLPVWAWAAGVGVAFLALKYVGGRAPAAVGGAGIATAAPIQPTALSPGAASGVGSLAAPTLPPPPPSVNTVWPGYSQPVSVPMDQQLQHLPNDIVSTPSATAPSSHLGSSPSLGFTLPAGAPGQIFTNVGSTPIAFNAHMNAPVVGAPSAARASVASAPVSQYGGVGAGPFVPGGSAAPNFVTDPNQDPGHNVF